MLNFDLTIYLWYIFWLNILTISVEMIEDVSSNLNSITNPHLSLRDDPRPLCRVHRRGRTPVSWAEGASPPGVPRAPPRSSPPSLYCSHCAVLCYCMLSAVVCAARRLCRWPWDSYLRHDCSRNQQMFKARFDGKKFGKQLFCLSIMRRVS